MSRLIAACYDRFTAGVEAAGLADWRRDLVADLEGEVLEIGAGTGHNLPWYPSTVRRLVLTEPDPYMRAKLEAKVEAKADAAAGRTDGPAVIEVLDRSADDLGVADASVDAVVGTLVLCTVPDPVAALAEVRRVLRPGGRFVYLEHIAATDTPRTLRWQAHLEPLWRRVAGNCHLTRTTERAVVDAGFAVETEWRAAMPAAPAILRPTVRGIARRPA